MSQGRRSSPLLPSLLAVACFCLLCCRLPVSFLTTAPGQHGRQQRTAMRGFKEDFEAWRSSLTPEEKEMVQTQAAGEFNKKFRKSDEFKKDLPEEKVKSFSKILGKFFDAEAADYKKEVAAKVPNYNRLLEKAGDKVLDFSMTNRIVTIDRDADRRYHYASRKIKKAQEKGEMFPQSSPMIEVWELQNDSPEAHEELKLIFEELKKAGEGLSGEEKKAFDEEMKAGIPAMGEKFQLKLPLQLVNQLNFALNMLGDAADEYAANHTDAELNAVMEKNVPEIWETVSTELVQKYYAARAEVEEKVDQEKAFFRSASKDLYKTKADVLKSIWAELPKHGKPVPPLDDELIAELAEEPAWQEGEVTNWGTAETLYKSEAIDAFGMRYLLGVFDTQEEAKKAFNEWNAEYEKGRKDMAAEMEQWSKQEQARMEADSSGSDRIKKILEEARR